MCKSLAIAVLVASFLPALASASPHAASATIRVPVTHSQPVFETVRVNQPYEACRMQTIHTRSSPQRPSRTINILGAIAVGALGRHLGHGRSEEQLGTIVGGMLGYTMADEIQQHRNAQRPHARATTEVCEWVDQWETRRELVGYDVTYELAGQTFTSFSRSDPGATMEISLIPSR